LMEYHCLFGKAVPRSSKARGVVKKIVRVTMRVLSVASQNGSYDVMKSITKKTDPTLQPVVVDTVATATKTAISKARKTFARVPVHVLTFGWVLPGQRKPGGVLLKTRSNGRTTGPIAVENCKRTRESRKPLRRTHIQSGPEPSQGHEGHASALRPNCSHEGHARPSRKGEIHTCRPGPNREGHAFALRPNCSHASGPRPSHENKGCVWRQSGHYHRQMERQSLHQDKHHSPTTPRSRKADTVTDPTNMEM